LRSPCGFGIPWADVVTRRVVDLATGETIDKYDARVERLPVAVANRRLLHVADIAIEVTHSDKRGVWRSLIHEAVRWSDEPFSDSGGRGREKSYVAGTGSSTLTCRTPPKVKFST